MEHFISLMDDLLKTIDELDERMEIAVNSISFPLCSSTTTADIEIELLYGLTDIIKDSYKPPHVPNVNFDVENNILTMKFWDVDYNIIYKQEISNFRILATNDFIVDILLAKNPINLKKLLTALSECHINPEEN